MEKDRWCIGLRWQQPFECEHQYKDGVQWMLSEYKVSDGRWLDRVRLAKSMKLDEALILPDY